MPDFCGPVFEHMWLPGYILLSDMCSVSILSTFHEIISSFDGHQFIFKYNSSFVRVSL